MRFIDPCRSHLKKLAFFALCLGLLTIMSMPGTVLAGTVYSNGTAFIDWSTLNITLGGISFDPASAGGVPSTFAGSQVQLSSAQTEFALSDFGDGTQSLSSPASIPDPLPNPINPNASYVSALGQTTANLGATTGLCASLTQNLVGFDNAGLANGTPNQGQSNFYYFGFTAPLTGPLDLQVSVNYLLTNSLSSNDPNGFVTSDVFAGLFLLGYDLNGPLNDPFKSAQAELNDSIIGSGTGGGSYGGTLTLTYLLNAGDLYDLGGEVSVTGSGSAVPVPAPLLLLASGLLGLGALKRSKKIVLN